MDDQNRYAAARAVFCTDPQSSCFTAAALVGSLFRKWRPPAELRRTRLFKGDRNPSEQRLAHTLDWLRDEELHRVYAMGAAAWTQQESARWPEERTSPMELFEWCGDHARDPYE